MSQEERIQHLPVWIKRVSHLVKKLRFPGKIIYMIVSILATLWFLFRVIPKPSRATYPCMQVAAPMMSGFVIWVLSLGGAALALKKARYYLFRARYIAAGLFLILGMAGLN